MRVVTAEEMRALDRRAITEGGIPGVVLMENAGRSVFEFLYERFQPLRDRRFLILCGTGNNGGDGFVTARYLRLHGAQVLVSLVGDPDKIRADARVHFDLMRNLGIEPQPPVFGNAVKVDALLGTGIQGPPREEFAQIIRAMNADRQPTVAVDIPSGVDSDTGATPGEAVRATATVTFAYPKLGMFLAPGANCVGELIVRNIGFDWRILQWDATYFWIRPEDLRSLLPPRPPDAHKGDFGHLLIVGGSRGMSGAVAMAAKAALRMGVGLVTIAVPESAQPLVAAKLDEAMTLAVAERDGALCTASLAPIAEMAQRCDALCIGPGATQAPEAQELLRTLARYIPKPMVIDADGLNALAASPDALLDHAAPTVLTPHPGECARLLGTDTAAVQSDRIGAVRRAAERWGAVVALKGARTLICEGPGSQERRPHVAINTTGNPGMATGGSGDSLTGIIGALIAQGLAVFDAARLGVYLHGRAGDLAAAEKGEASLIAGDITDALPRAIRELEGEE